MAEPLSIIATSFELAGVCIKVAKFLREAAAGIKTVDGDLVNLSQEIVSLQNTNDAIRRHFEDDINASAKTIEVDGLDEGAVGTLWTAFDAKLAECGATLEDLEGICAKIHDGSGDKSKGNTNTPDFINRTKRWIRKYLKEDELAKFRQRIKAHQDGLQLLLTAANIVYTRRAQSHSKESIELIRSLRAELRRGIAAVQKDIGARNDEPSTVLASARAVMPLAYVNEHFSLPQAVSSSYIGREDELDKLNRVIFREEQEDGGGRGASPKPKQQKRFVVYGLGGAGKSQFCCKWAQDNRHRFWGVFWVDATSVQSARKSFAEIARLGKVNANERAAKAWLSSKDRPWLLIIDNLDDPAIAAEQYFPEGERGVILITTRNYQLRTHGTAGMGFFHFRELDCKASKDLLLRTAGELAPWSTASLSLAGNICQKLGFLPLAIIHAGKAILSHVCSLTTYMEYFEQSWTRVRQVRRERRLSETNITVFSSYELAFQGLLKNESQMCEDAVELLKMFAFLHCRGVRVSTLIQAATNPILEGAEAKKQQQALATQPEAVAASRKPFSKAAKDLVVGFVVAITRMGEVPVLPKVLRDVDPHGEFNELRLREALKELHQMSLLEYDAAEDSYSMHSLIHVWVRERPQMSLAEQAVWCQAAGTVLAQAVILPPLGTRESDEDLRRDILPHVHHVQAQEQRIREQGDRNRQLSARWWRFWPVVSGGTTRSQIAQRAKFSLVWAHNGLYREALAQQQIVADFLCRRLGKDNPVTVRLLLFMSDIYWALSDGDRASDLLEDLRTHCVLSLGADHEDTTRVLDKLANTRWLQSRFAEARDLLEDVVTKLTRLHGPEHPDTLRAKSGLGRAVGKFFEFDRALELHREALAGLEKDAAFQRSHTDTLAVIDSLAMAYFDRYYYVHGDDNNSHSPESTGNNGDDEETEEGRPRADLDKAHELLVEVVQARRVKLGKEHAFTLWSILNLARVKAARGDPGDLAAAEKMMRDGLKIATRNLGETHLGILYCKAQLARVLMRPLAAPTGLVPTDDDGERRRRLAEAEALLLEVNATYEASWTGHGDQMVSMAYLIGCYRTQGKTEEAAPLMERLLEGTRRIFGEGSRWENYVLRKYCS
ncbi:TPR-like protein [Apiospora rasikravindrae]|uniref:TPR-like protein n=1 Tax=Apiospora rasikravindrae TaxID=990691 RepID=A0ABR1SEX7_9PEZI